MSSVNVMITISPCCDRLRFLTDTLTQARNLSLSEPYQLALENLILDLMPLITNNDSDGIVSIYDANIDNILTLRDSAFLLWMNDIKNKYIPVEKTPPPEEITP